MVDLAVGLGMPRMPARVLIALWLSADGRLTAAGLARGLGVSPASVSVAVGYLIGQGLIRREPQGRRDVYVVDNDAWYQSMVTGAQQTLAAAQAAKQSAERLGLDADGALNAGVRQLFLVQHHQLVQQAEFEFEPVAFQQLKSA